MHDPPRNDDRIDPVFALDRPGPIVAFREVEPPYYDPITGRCPHGVRAPHECREGCES